jgi:hypothetical protein
MLPSLYLNGMSTGEAQLVLEVLLASQAKGLSVSTISRLEQMWRAEYEIWQDQAEIPSGSLDVQTAALFASQVA